MLHNDHVPVGKLPNLINMCQKLSEAVCKSINLAYWVLEEYERCAVATADERHVVPIMLTYDFIEAIDGVAILASMGSSQNCNVLLRTAYEIVLSAIYITQSDGEFKRRGLAYEFFHARNQLHFLERADPGTAVGRPLRAELYGDPHAAALDWQDDENLPHLLGVHRSRLGSSRYADIVLEIEKMKSNRQKPKDWYALWGGPTDIRQLAKQTMGIVSYETLYRTFSGTTHGATSLSRRLPSSPGTTMIRPIRSPDGLPLACALAVRLSIALSSHLVELQLPDKLDEFNLRMTNDIRPAKEFINRHIPD